MKYVIGIDLGTSAVKLMLISQNGYIVNEISKKYSLIQNRSGYNEQDPEDWINQTISGLKDLVSKFQGHKNDIKGISFSGQMHGLVLVDHSNNILRNAILWNDTRTSEECNEINKKVGKQRLLSITKNLALEGFTLPKILWVKKHEPNIYKNIKKFMLPKDYVRFCLTGQIHTDFSDAAGTLLLDIQQQDWSQEILNYFDIAPHICPEIVESSEYIGEITEEISDITGLSRYTAVFAGGADNACGAVGSGILEKGKTMVSIGTSGVLLTYENDVDKKFEGKVHYFNHAIPNEFYSMGVTLAAGHSLSWLKDTFFKDETFDSLINEIKDVPIGSKGLLFSPYIVGERTPYMNADLRGSFIGIDSSHSKKYFIRAVLEGITFSLKDTLEIFKNGGKKIDSIISIGGGAKNDVWLQMQADVFDTEIIKLKHEQGPGFGSAMIAAYGVGWFNSIKECWNQFAHENIDSVYKPNKHNVSKYKKIYKIYTDIYASTKHISEELADYRK